MKTIFVAGLFPDRNRTFLQHLASRFRVIMSRSSDGWAAGRFSVEFLEDLVPGIDEGAHQAEFVESFVDLLQFSSVIQPESGLERPDGWDPESYAHIQGLTYRLSRNAALMRRLHERVPVDLVIVNADYSAYSRPYVLEARRLGIRTMSIEHGYFNAFPEPSGFRTPLASTTVFRFISDFVNVDNALEVDLLEAHRQQLPDRQHVQIVPLGTPNDLSFNQRVGRQEAASTLNVQADCFTVSVIGSWQEGLLPSMAFRSQLDQLDFYETAFDELARLQAAHGIQVIVKHHPSLASNKALGETTEFLRCLAADKGLELACITHQGLEEVLAATDLFLSFSHSSVLWEGFLARKPSVVLPLKSHLATLFRAEGLSTSNLLFREGLVRHVFDAAALREALLDFLDPDHYAGVVSRIEALTHEHRLSYRSAAEKSIAIGDFIEHHILAHQNGRAEELGASLWTAAMNGEGQEMSEIHHQVASGNEPGDRGLTEGGIAAGGYYSRINQPLAGMVPPSAKRILEVGCGAGYLGAWLKAQDPSREVVGLELFPEAAADARRRLDQVIEGDVETMLLPYPPGYFDCILYGDVLEHLKDPATLLARHREHLAPSGHVLVCIPNVAHWSVLLGLLGGRFDYADEGLLDRTHLRFFTQASFRDVLAEAGLRVLETTSIDVPNPGVAAALRSLTDALGIDNPGIESQSNAYQLLFRSTHAVEVVSSDAPSFDLPEHRAFNVLCLDGGDGERAIQALLAFTDAFAADEDVALFVASPLAAEQLLGRFQQALASVGRDPEAIPEVVLLDNDSPQPRLRDYLPLADLVLGDADVLREARQLGIPGLGDPTPGELAAARASARTRRSEATSIVVVTYNSMKTLENCLTSALATMGPHDELIVVDNASADETPDFLRRFATRDARVQVKLSETNLGFSAGSNLGLREATGDFLVLLNPDTVVTPGWLERLRAPFLRDPSVGAVGPTSDYVAGWQKVHLHLPEIGATSMTLDDVTARLAARNAGKVLETKLLIGFCVMFSRRALDEVGLLDEELFLGNDDLDMSWRLRKHGYRLLVATDAFVHHVGQVSFNTEPSERTRQLVQESTDALARKLVRHYGDGKVPSAMDLWEIDWFEPTSGILEGREGAQSDSPVKRGGGLVSIVLLGYNQLFFTRLCIESLLAHTDEPFELILIDNGSTDGTGAYFKQLEAQDDRIRAVLNPKNLGFAGGCNQGIALARGEYVLFLNNDTLVPQGWLGRLRAHLEQKPVVGAVGAVSNCVSGPQQLERVPFVNHPSAQAEIYAFADDLSRRMAGRGFELARLVGFCLMVRRSVLDKIGGFDPRFGIGNFEDDDLCLRIRTAGYQTWVAQDVYIHHFGSRTFAALGPDAFEDTMDESWEYFKEKWNLSPALDRRYPYRVEIPPFSRAQHVVPLPSLEDADCFAAPDPFRPAVPPLVLPDRKRVAFFHHPDWSREGWQKVLQAYIQAFTPDQEVSLVIWLDPVQGVSIEDASQRLLAALEAIAVEPDLAPDLILVPDVLDLAGLASLYAATDCVVPAGDSTQEERAAKLGLRILRDLAPGSWREVAQSLLGELSAEA